MRVRALFLATVIILVTLYDAFNARSELELASTLVLYAAAHALGCFARLVLQRSQA